MEETGYTEIGWEFKEGDDREDFERLKQVLDAKMTMKIVEPKDVESEDLKYPDGLAYSVNRLLEEGWNIQLVRCYRMQPVKKSLLGAFGLGPHHVKAGPYREAYVLDATTSAAFIGDQEIIDYLENEGLELNHLMAEDIVRDLP